MATKKLTKSQLRKLLKDWENGRSKLDIDKSIGATGRGKTISRLWEQELDLVTTNI